MPLSVTAAFENLLPARIDGAEVEGPTLLLSGAQWSLAATCDWKWFDSEGVITGSEDGQVDAVWDLVGHRIVSATWSSTPLALTRRSILRVDRHWNSTVMRVSTLGRSTRRRSFS